MDENQTPEQRRAEKRFNVATDVRKFEISLFWTRSLFFWGFIAAAFIAYATFARNREQNSDLMLVVGCFGVVCSFAWSLLNRGSKYWQESWEQKVKREEKEVLGEKFFARWEGAESKFWLLRARKYSVSKLVMALSDFTFLTWVFLLVKTVPWDKVGYVCLPWAVLILAFVGLYMIYMAIWCRTAEPAPDEERPNQPSTNSN